MNKKIHVYFKKLNMEDRIIEFDKSSASVQEAADDLHCEPGMIAKTMAFLVNDGPIVIVCSGDKKIDNHKYKEYFKTKAKMVPATDLYNIIGFHPGGVTPFKVNDNVKVYLDISLKNYDEVYPAGGTPTSAIKLKLNELEKYSNYIDYIDVCS